MTMLMKNKTTISKPCAPPHKNLEYTPYGELWINHRNNNLIDSMPYRFTGKELDSETGFYYFGARYLDPRTSRWISTDPAINEYIPRAPINDEARRHNANLPGLGGIFNYINMHVYHYGANNPIRYIDPDGRLITDHENKTITFEDSDFADNKNWKNMNAIYNMAKELGYKVDGADLTGVGRQVFDTFTGAFLSRSMELPPEATPEEKMLGFLAITLLSGGGAAAVVGGAKAAKAIGIAFAGVGLFYNLGRGEGAAQSIIDAGVGAGSSIVPYPAGALVPLANEAAKHEPGRSFARWLFTPVDNSKPSPVRVF